MEFMIERTNGMEYVDEYSQPPCDEAYIKTYISRTGDVRTDWFINIQSIEELLETVDRNDDFIIFKDANYFGVREIEIYDEYRE